jgi:hypothetical protein
VHKWKQQLKQQKSLQKLKIINLNFNFLIFMPNGSDLTLPKELEEILAKMTPETKKEFWEYTLKRTKELLTMAPKEQEQLLKEAVEQATLIEQQLKLLDMKPEERLIELRKLGEEAEKLKFKSEKEWEEAIEVSWRFLADDELVYRKKEAEKAKEITQEKTQDLIESFKNLLTKEDLPGCGLILKRLAVSGRLGEILNYYGYQSNLVGLHRFFNEIVIGVKPIVGEKAFDNFLFQQRAYLIEHDISCLAEGLNQWSLAFAIGKKKREWYQLEEREHLLAVVQAVKKIKPGVAARIFSPLSYGSQIPLEKFNVEAGSFFELGREGKLILMLFADTFEKQLIKKEFNPEAARVLFDEIGELEIIGMKPSFIEALRNYVKEIETTPGVVEEIEKEFKK